MKSPYWSPEEEARLAELYPDTDDQQIAERLGRPQSGVQKKAMRMGLRKSEVFCNQKLWRVVARKRGSKIRKNERTGFFVEELPGDGNGVVRVRIHRIAA